MKRKIMFRLLAIPLSITVFLSLLTAFTLPSTAFAASRTAQHATVPAPLCSNIGCDGKSAFATHCAGQSWDRVWPVTSAPIRSPQRQVGVVILWWSATCSTNWGEIVIWNPPPFKNNVVGGEMLIQWDTTVYGTIYSSTHYLDQITTQAYAPIALAGFSGMVANEDGKGSPEYRACAHQGSGTSLCY